MIIVGSTFRAYETYKHFSSVCILVLLVVR